MLRSTVFILRPLTEGRLPLLQGQAIHALFLRLVQHQEPLLAEWLHSQERHKPFTTSPLQGTFTSANMEVVVQPEYIYWLRVTSMAPELSAFLGVMEEEPPAEVRLFQVDFEVCAVTSHPHDHEWAGQSTYEHLYTQAWQGAPEAQGTLEFASPTFFRFQGRNLVMPSPRMVFSSLWENWHAFSPVPLPPALLPLLITEIDVLRYELKTQVNVFGTYRQIGFLGSCTFGMPRQISVDVLRGMQLLLDMAFFTGVGNKTTTGMGQARCLE